MKTRSLLAVAALATACGVASAQVQDRTIRFGHGLPPGHPITLGVLKLAELVAVRSSGKIRIQELGGGTLGGEAQQLSAVRAGFQDMTLTSASVLSGVVKEFALLDIPFALDRAEQFDALLDGPFGQALKSRINREGVVGLSFWETGFRNVTNSRRPIASIDDLKGLKLRVIPSAMLIQSFGALGANAIPTPFPELYVALESRTVDAQENPFSVVLTSRFYEVQKYMSVTNHVYTSNLVVISRRTWDALSAQEQKMIQDAVQEAGEYERRVSRSASPVARRELEARGMRINEVPPATLARMRELTQPVAEKLIADFDPELVRLYWAEVERVRAGVR